MFSPLETKVLKVLGNRKLKIKDIVVMIYKGKKKPLGANNGIAQAVRRINSKCRYNKLSWFLNGTGLGCQGKTVWRDE